MRTHHVESAKIGTPAAARGAARSLMMPVSPAHTPHPLPNQSIARAPPPPPTRRTEVHGARDLDATPLRAQVRVVRALPDDGPLLRGARDGEEAGVRVGGERGQDVVRDVGGLADEERAREEGEAEGGVVARDRGHRVRVRGQRETTAGGDARSKAVLLTDLFAGLEQSATQVLGSSFPFATLLASF